MQPLLREPCADALRGLVSQGLMSRSEGGLARVVAREILVHHDATKEAIRDPARYKTISQILERSADQGMRTFNQSLTSLVSARVVDIETAALAVASTTNFRRNLQMRGARDVP